MSGTTTWEGKVNEDGSYAVLARIVALEGSGDEVQPGEGNCIEQADVSSITCTVYNLGTNRLNESGTQITPAPALTASGNIFDTLRTTGWKSDPYGYNFRHLVAPAYTPSANVYYKLEYQITLVGGGVIKFAARVKSNSYQSS